MADEQMMEMDNLGEEGGAAPSDGKSPIMKYLPWIVGLLIVQVVLAYFVAHWFFSPAPTPEKPAGQTEVAASAAEPQPESDSKGGYKTPKAPEVNTIYDKLDVIVVNPAGTDGLRFLSTQVFLGLSSPKVEEYITSHSLVYRIKDTLVRTLSSKTIPELDPSKQDQLKQELKEKLNAFLGKNAVVDIYFQSFVLQ